MLPIIMKATISLLVGISILENILYYMPKFYGFHFTFYDVSDEQMIRCA